MSDNLTPSLQEKAATVQSVVDRLVSICSGFESDEWLAKYIAVQRAMLEGRLKDAVREEGRLTRYTATAKWVVSFELERVLEKAMGVLHRHICYPDHSEAPLMIPDLPADVTVLGTRELQGAVYRRALSKRFDGRSIEEVKGAFVVFEPEELERALSELRLESERCEP